MFLMLTVSAAADEDVQKISILDSDHYWQASDFIRLYPAVRFPTNPDATDLIRVYLRLPDKSLIDIDTTNDFARFKFPVGTKLDRVESLLINGRPKVIDVRGTSVQTSGKQQFDLLRAMGPEPNARLEGFSWPAESRESQQSVDHQLKNWMPQTWLPKSASMLQEEQWHALLKVNHCSQCHDVNKNKSGWAETDSLPHRNTDTSGFFTPMAVFAEYAPLPETRARDLNLNDPYCDFICSDGSAPAYSGKNITFRPLVCADGSAVLVHRDIAAGIADNDDYSNKVCESRRYLISHMTRAAQEIYQSSLKACENYKSSSN